MYGALLPKGPRGHVDAGLGKGVPLLGTRGPDRPDRGDPRDRHRARDRRRAHRVPAHAGHRGAGRDELPLPRPARAVHGRELHRDPAQPLHAARRAGARRARLEQVHQRVDRAVRRRDRRRVREPPLAALGRRGGAPLPREAARPLPLPARPDDAPRQPRPDHARDRRGARAARRRSPTSSSTRDYYGTVNHNAKAVYQRYLGWFDGNPANLHPLPPVEAGRRYVELTGGADEVLRKARDELRRAASTAGWPRS